MKQFVLACPSHRSGFELLSLTQPLALWPILGRPLLDRVLQDLAERGFATGTVLVARPSAVLESFLLAGQPWGLEIEIRAVGTEPSQEHMAKLCPGAEMISLDTLPGSAQLIWRSPADLFSTLISEIARAGLDDADMIQLLPGIFVHRRARLASDVRLTGPCWIGDARIGSAVEIGHGAIVEDRCLIDDHACVTETLVAPDTYVGEGTKLRSSFALGNLVLNWRTGLPERVTDRFLLGSLAEPATLADGWAARLRRGWRVLMCPAGAELPKMRTA